MGAERQAGGKLILTNLARLHARWAQAANLIFQIPVDSTGTVSSLEITTKDNDRLWTAAVVPNDAHLQGTRKRVILSTVALLCRVVCERRVQDMGYDPRFFRMPVHKIKHNEIVHLEASYFQPMPFVPDRGQYKLTVPFRSPPAVESSICII